MDFLAFTRFLSVLLFAAALAPPDHYVAGSFQAPSRALHLESESDTMVSNHSNEQHFDPVSKRWFSVQTLDELNNAGRLRQAGLAPWPVLPCGQWVRYCFKNEQSANRLLDILLHAIALWMPVEQYSALKIVPDVACRNPDSSFIWRCVCGPQINGMTTAGDALVIGDGQEYNLEDWHNDAYTNVGYDYTSDRAGRHELVFGIMNTAPPADVTAEDLRSYRIMNMAHELDQRPDRDTYMVFQRQYLLGYNDARQAVQNPRQPNDFAPGTTVDQRLDALERDFVLASTYWPMLKAYMKLDNTVNYPGQGLTDWPETQERFDYGSIMMYSSVGAVLTETAQAFLAMQVPIARRVPSGDFRFPGALTYMGGDADSANARPSAQDFKRVAQLYPGTLAQQQAAAAMVNWQPQMVNNPPYVDNERIAPNPLQVYGPNYVPADP